MIPKSGFPVFGKDHAQKTSDKFDPLSDQTWRCSRWNHGGVEIVRKV
jgi:hypothetical protein